MLSLVLWSVVSFVAGRTLADLNYEPVVFGSGYRSAAIFLEARVQTLGGVLHAARSRLHAAGAAVLLVLLPR